MDHIDFKKNISSLSINIKKKNIGGVKKFRLLLPETRNGALEIFWSSLMEDLGFPVPLRKLINVNLNGQIIEYIFEEKPEKEFLESIGIRESPIIESDERQLWALRAFGRTNRKISDQWIPQFKLKNPDFIKNEISEKISIRALSYEGDMSIKELPQYDASNESIFLFDQLNARHASHALIPHNRKYVYDPIYNQLIPIYAEGNIGMRDIDKDRINDDCKNYDEALIEKYIVAKINLLEIRYSDRVYDKKLSKNMRCLASIAYKTAIKNNKHDNSVLKNIIPIVNRNLDMKKYSRNILEEKNLIGYPDIFQIDYKNKKIEYVKYDYFKKEWNIFKTSTFQDLIKILSGRDNPKILNDYPIYNLVNLINFDNTIIESFDEIKAVNKSIDIYVKKNETLFIKANLINATLNIKLESSDSKVVFYNSSIKNSRIISFTLNENNDNEVHRYDERLLTSCNTIINSYILDSFLKSENCNLEDSINFISSEGSGVSLQINNSISDGFDADFSNIDFNNIQVDNSGNDCIDISSGVYNFKKIILSNCGDKGLSIGEKSISTVLFAKIINSNIGIAVKDQSTAYIHNFENKNIESCINVYRKKSEYGPATVHYKKNIDNLCRVNLANSSVLNENKICRSVKKNNMFELCFFKNKINIHMLKQLPDDSFFVLESKNDTGTLKAIYNKNFIDDCYKNNNCDIAINENYPINNLKLRSNLLNIDYYNSGKVNLN